MSVSTGLRKKLPRADRISVACQTDAPYLNANGLSPASSQQLCAMGTSGSWNHAVEASDPSTTASSDTPASQTNRSQETSTSSKTTASSNGNDIACTLEDDGEGVLRLNIDHFSQLSDTVCSPSKRIRGVPWRIMVMPKQHMVQKKSQKCMGFFLQCCPDKTYSDAWSVRSDAEMRLVSQKPGGVSNFVRKTSHTYTAKENDWGYSCFMTWADVLDESQGYIKNDKVSLEITVKAEWPKNMMSRDEFVKSIDQWYNLAEMQMSRGQIDLSLEANNQALAFCKDKDTEMRQRLEAQKARLVKHKLLASIDRIETNKDSPIATEPLKPTSLRQALNGAQKNIAAKGTVKQNTKKDRRATMQQMKKKKQDLANKEKELKRKTAEWEEVNSQLSSLSSEERKSPSIPSPPCTPVSTPADVSDLNDEAAGNHEAHNQPCIQATKKLCPVHDMCPRSNFAKKMCQTLLKMDRARDNSLVGTASSSKPSSEATSRRPIAQTCAVSVTHTVTKDGTRQRCRESISMTHSSGGRSPKTRIRNTTFSMDDAVDEFKAERMIMKTLSDGINVEKYLVEMGDADMIELNEADGKLLSDNMRKIKQEISSMHKGMDVEVTASDLDIDTDDSEDYQEHGSMRDITGCPQCLAKDSCVHDSMESLREDGADGDTAAPVYVTENGCQTEETGEMSVCTHPHVIPRRERRHAGTGVPVSDLIQNNGSSDCSLSDWMSPINKELDKMTLATDCVNKAFHAAESTSDFRGLQIDRTRLARLYVEHVGVHDEDLASVMALIEGSELAVDPTLMPFLSTANMFSQLDNLSDDHGTCCLAAGLCAVQSRRVLASTSDFFKIAIMIIDQTVETTAVISSYMKNYDEKDKGAFAVPAGRIVKTAVRRTGANSSTNTPSEFSINLTDDVPKAEYEESELHIVSSALLNELLSNVADNKLDQFVSSCETEFEKSIQVLMGDMGSHKVNELIRCKLDEMRSAEGHGKSTGGLYQLLNQLYEYSRALTVSGQHLERLVETAKKIHEYQQDKHVYHVQVSQVVKNTEERLAAAEQSFKNMSQKLQDEIGSRVKAQGQLVAEEAKFHSERDRAEQMQTQLKDLRNQMKKLQKKFDAEENKVSVLTHEKTDLEDKIKLLKRDNESMKKKNAEERNNRKKDKDRDIEIIRRNENDLADRDAELERERHSHEEKTKEWRSKESKWEKERKHHQTTLSATIDRARVAEVAQLELTLASAMDQLKKAKQEAQMGISDAEDNLKRARTHADLETMKRSMAEWRAVEDELVKLTKTTKSDYDSAIDLVRKGTRMLAQITDLKMPAIPAMPKSVRLPPVQVVQPSTPVTPAAPSIPAPPAGVIGQPRTPHRIQNSGASRDLHSPSTSAAPNGVHSSLFPRAPSPPATSPFKMTRGSLQQDPIGNTTPTSPWSWSTPLALGNLDDIRSDSHHDIFAAAEPIMQTPPQVRAAYGQSPLIGGGWTPQGTWRAPQQPQQQPNAFAQQHQQSPHHLQMSRPPSMHYYDS